MKPACRGRKRWLANAVFVMFVPAACSGTGRSADQSAAPPASFAPAESSAAPGAAPPGDQRSTAEPDPSGMLGLRPRVLEVTKLAEAATEKLTNECLMPLGFSYQVPDGPERPEPPPFAPWRAASIDDTDELFDGAESDWAPATTTAEYSAALEGRQIEEWNAPADEELVLGQTAGGFVYDGCLPTAETEVIGGGDPKGVYRLEEMASMLEQLPYATFDLMLTETPFKEKAQAWTACMQDRGYTARGVFDIDFGSPSGLVTTQQQVDDYNACLADTGITAVGDAEYRDTQSTLVEEMYGSVEQWNAELDAIEQRATDALSN